MNKANYVCYKCGAWFRVTKVFKDCFIVTPVSEGEPVDLKSWTESASDPICPFDTTTLQENLIDFDSDYQVA